MRQARGHNERKPAGVPTYPNHTQVAVYIYLVPVFGVLAAALVLGDRLTPWAGLGGLTILAGVVVTNLGARRAPLTPAPPAGTAVDPEHVTR